MLCRWDKVGQLCKILTADIIQTPIWGLVGIKKNKKRRSFGQRRKECLKEEPDLPMKGAGFRGEPFRHPLLTVMVAHAVIFHSQVFSWLSWAQRDPVILLVINLQLTRTQWACTVFPSMISESSLGIRKHFKTSRAQRRLLGAAAFLQAAEATSPLQSGRLPSSGTL